MDCRFLAGGLPRALEKTGTGGVVATDCRLHACIFTRASDETAIRVNARVSALARDLFNEWGPARAWTRVGSWQVAPAGDEEEDGGGGEAVHGAAHG